MQMVAGHLSFGATPSRGASSLLDSVNRFAAKHWTSCGIPWVSLKCELRAHADLLPLLKGDRTHRCCPIFCPLDVHEKGWSSAVRTVPVSLVARHGRVLKRSFSQSGCERGDHAFQKLGLAESGPADDTLKCSMNISQTFLTLAPNSSP